MGTGIASESGHVERSSQLLSSGQLGSALPGADTPQSDSSTAYTGSSKRYDELTQRLRTVQRQMSILSSPRDPSVRSETHTGTESEATFRALEEEVYSLRHALATIRAQLEEQSGHFELLPAYEE